MFEFLTRAWSNGLSILGAFSISFLAISFWKSRPGNESERKAIEVLNSSRVLAGFVCVKNSIANLFVSVVLNSVSVQVQLTVSFTLHYCYDYNSNSNCRQRQEGSWLRRKGHGLKPTEIWRNRLSIGSCCQKAWLLPVPGTSACTDTANSKHNLSTTA